MNSALIQLSNDVAEAIEQAGKNIVAVNEGGRSGVSGTLWRDGLVVSTEHTIRGQQELTIELPNGASSSATVIGRDATTDIALLRLKEPVPATAEFADAGQLRVGHFVLAVGRRGKHGLAATHGVVSSLGGAWRTWRGGRIDQWFRLDLMPFTSFSGGPLIDAAGKIIGINTSGAQREVMTIPAETVNRVVDQLLAKGQITRGYLGVGLQPVQLPKTGRGLLVAMVDPSGPAEKAGVMVGDIIVAVAGKPLKDSAQLQVALDPEQVGTTIQLGILRGGNALDLSLTVAEREE